jgi:hypothetical protein
MCAATSLNARRVAILAVPDRAGGLSWRTLVKVKPTLVIAGKRGHGAHVAGYLVSCVTFLLSVFCFAQDRERATAGQVPTVAASADESCATAVEDPSRRSQDGHPRDAP